MPPAAASRAGASLLRQRRFPPPCNAPHRLLRRRAPCPRPSPLAELPPTHSGCALSARGCFASHSPLARSRALLPASQTLALSLHFAYRVAAARPSARVESRFQWQVRRVRAIPLLRRGIAPTRFFALAAGGILPVATALAAPPAFGFAPSKRKGLRHSRPPPSGAFLPTHSGCAWLVRGCSASRCPLARSRALLPASQILALSLHFAYRVATARPSARVESRFQWQVRRVRAIPLLRRGIAPTRFFALAAGGILPVATALAAPPAFGFAPSKRKGLRHSRPPPSGAFLPTHSGCFIYIPSFCEATGRKNRLMLATIE